MTTKRIKTPATISRTEAENILAEIRTLKLSEAKIQADREAAVAEIDKRVGPELDNIKQACTARVKVLQRWALDNRDIFDGKKTLDMQHGQLGWRISPPSVKTFTKLDDQEQLDLVELHLGTQFLRQQWEIDKSAILSNRQQITPEAMTAANLVIAQAETFFVSPTLPEPTTTETIKDAVRKDQ
jgi:phage host-nuclease inhibitor protein Gam